MNRLRTWIKALSPDCKQASRLQAEVVDQNLPFIQRLGLRMHLLFCRWCRRYGERLKFLRKAAHEHPGELNAPADQHLSPSARERMKQSLRAEQD